MGPPGRTLTGPPLVGFLQGPNSSFSSLKPHLTGKETEGPGLTVQLEGGRLWPYISIPPSSPPTNLPQQGNRLQRAPRSHTGGGSFMPSSIFRWSSGCLCLPLLEPGKPSSSHQSRGFCSPPSLPKSRKPLSKRWWPWSLLPSWP